jgi:maleamate amidohydrolase
MPDVYTQWGYSELSIGFGTKPCVLAIDFQSAFLKPDGIVTSPSIEAPLLATQKLLSVARETEVPVVASFAAFQSLATMQYWKIRNVGETLIAGSAGTVIDERIVDPSRDIVLQKSGPSIFFNSPLVNYLIKLRIDTVIITGCTTSGCVRASVTDAFQYGYRTIVVEDCVGDYDQAAHDSNLKDMHGRYADIMNSDFVIEHLRKIR